MACWANSVRDLYRFRVDHRETQGFDVYLQEAQWCLQNELPDLAQKELALAKAIMPQSDQVKRMEARIDRAVSPTGRSVPIAKNILPVNNVDTPTINYGLDQVAMGAFARSVQVTLVNRCGNCHAPETNRQWQINSPPGNSRASAETTNENVLATLPFIDWASPQRSPLLIKATTPHGGLPAPLGARHYKAIHSLKYWLQQAGRSMRNEAEADAINAQERVARSLPDSYMAKRPQQQPEQVLDQARQFPENTEDSTTPNRMPQVQDPFDPELFNRQYHR